MAGNAQRCFFLPIDHLETTHTNYQPILSLGTLCALQISLLTPLLGYALRPTIGCQSPSRVSGSVTVDLWWRSLRAHLLNMEEESLIFCKNCFILELTQELHNLATFRPPQHALSRRGHHRNVYNQFSLVRSFPKHFSFQFCFPSTVSVFGATSYRVSATSG